METAKQWFGHDFDIAQLDLKSLVAWEEEISRQLKSGEELGAAKQHFLATLSKGVDLLHEAYVESGRKRVVEYLVARQHSLAGEQCSCSELLAMDNEGLKEMVDVHSKVFEEQITQHQVAEEQAKQQCKGIRNALEVAQREAVNWKAKSSKYKAMVTG